ncbi:hypothetical protein [Micromonospora sp. WMMD998]|uniref:hypothetical protein n=1 Tax=Micromonospora sp. WMMD998 TaxID=3016092 RepID=UPI002499B90B|nr:hypothetical protein [Micromonospora sp. WMMD998]WFE41914.1 hypothetical protein O7619_27100 [Micromonospora sp. WMMD998]
MIASIWAGLAESAGEVAGLALTVVVVAVVAVIGRRQEVARAAARRRPARPEPAPLDVAECGTAVDPWPDADDADEASLRDLVAVWAGAQ